MRRWCGVKTKNLLGRRQFIQAAGSAAAMMAISPNTAIARLSRSKTNLLGMDYYIVPYGVPVTNALTGYLVFDQNLNYSHSFADIDPCTHVLRFGNFVLLALGGSDSGSTQLRVVNLATGATVGTTSLGYTTLGINKLGRRSFVIYSSAATSIGLVRATINELGSLTIDAAQTLTTATVNADASGAGEVAAVLRYSNFTVQDEDASVLWATRVNSVAVFDSKVIKIGYSGGTFSILDQLTSALNYSRQSAISLQGGVALTTLGSANFGFYSTGAATNLVAISGRPAGFNNQSGPPQFSHVTGANGIAAIGYHRVTSNVGSVALCLYNASTNSHSTLATITVDSDITVGTGGAANRRLCPRTMNTSYGAIFYYSVRDSATSQYTHFARKYVHATATLETAKQITFPSSTSSIIGVGDSSQLQNVAACMDLSN